MKFATDRRYSDPEKAARKLIEIANAVELVQDKHPAMTRVMHAFGDHF
jgi:hypothetical protein